MSSWNRHGWRALCLLLGLLAAAGLPVQAAEVLLESGAVDIYETPVMPPCPDGREAELAAEAARREEIPPRTLPVSIHQAELEYYKQFDADTEREWDTLKAARRLEEAVPVPAGFAPLGASKAGPFVLEKEVFGWMPYWEGSAYTNFSFDLLSTVAYFSYEVNSGTGYATDMHSWSNTPLVAWAHSNGVDVVLCATLMSGHSTFFGSSAAQSNLINELVRLVQLRDADGVNIDFEAIPGGYKASLTAFMSNLTVRMHADVPGSQVSICLPAVDWSSNFDVAAYEGFLDQCIMMGYDYSWSTDSQAGPVAPLKTSTIFGSLSVGKSVSNYLAAGLSPGKLLLGVPYYGYDWATVSHALHAATNGPCTSRTYPSAKSYASTYGYLWDTNSLTPYVLYGSYQQLWYDDTNSLALKYDFANSKSLAGIGIWALNYDEGSPDLWDLLAEKFATTSLPWTVQTSGTTTSLYGAAFGSNTFVAVGTAGAIHSSTNITTWAARNSGTTRLLLNATFGHGQFVAVGDGGTIQTSPDGVTWTTRSPPVTNMLRSVAWGSTNFVTVGNEGALATSSDGATWTARSSGTNGGLQGVVYGTDKFVAAGNTGLILTSPDGVTWTTRVSGVSNWLLDVCHGNNLFVAVGTGGRIITSADGITWATQTSGTSDQLYRAAYGDGTYIAVGVNGTILRSSDGADWNADASGVTNSLRGVTYGNGAFLAAGYEGTLLTSGDYEPPAGGAEAEEEGALAVTPAPDGALSNIVVYCSAGHGFTANTNVGGWYVGRSLVNGVVEDMGNVDQINTFVQYCLNAGAAVVPCRPVGYQTNQVILDNDDASVAFTGTWANSSSTIFYGTAGDTPYKYAYISTNGATAGARYTPTIPTGGFYPVYTWVLYSSNRARQLYRIRHSGGINEIRVNHRRVGAGWVWLGTYYFEAGTNGYVDISNYAPGYDPVSDVVIADAIRFGNGMGDINRGWGVSGYEKELEASRYWVQGMTGEGMASTLYDRPTLDDSDDNVGAPTRISDYMDNEADGDFWDRIYLGFHSNADGGAGTTRGAMGLYSTANTAACQARQQAFATALNSEIETDFEYLDNGVGFNDDWTDTSSDVYGSVYGEISEGYNSNMNHTIIEVAYHNNAEDARLLKDPAARLYFSRACFKGLVKHLNANNPSVPLAFLPDPPTAPRAVNVSGGVTVSWTAPATNTASGQAATSYRVYQSTNGYGFGSPTATTNTSVTVTNLAEGGVYYFRVTALNAGGESLPSEVVGARVSPMGRAYHVVVNGFERFDRGLSPTRYFSGGSIGGSVTMVRPRQINSFDYVVQHGQAIAAAGRFFDSCSQMAAASNAVPLTNYHAAYWILGEESTTNETFSSVEQARVTNFLARGGNLFASGAEIAWDLDYKGAAADKVFCSNALKTAYASDDAATNRVTARTGSVFDGVGTLTFSETADAIYGVEYPDVFYGRGGATTALVYGASGTGSSVAAIQYSNVYRLVVMGFPFETILETAARTNLMKKTLTFFGDSPAETPVLDITSGNATVAFATATADIDGTNNAAVVGNLAWTNALTGGAGTHAAAASWTISGIALDVGTNVITVRGTNTYAQSSSDSVSIVRQPEAGSGAIFEDDFEDGDLVGWTQDSVGNWTNSTSTPITGSRSLKHNLSSTATTNYIYAQPVYSLATSQTVWRFNLKNGSFDPSANNKFWVYLIANEGNLRSSTVDGYAVGVNLTGSDDLLKLWRVTDGAAASVVAASTLDWGSSFTVGIEVTRSTNGLWELKYDANGGFDALVSAGMGTDTTYTVTSYFGLLFQCTSSYAGLLRWDDISIYFTNNVSPDPDGDDDGDGMSNYEESIAGTDRDDEDSVFTATGARAAGGGNLIQWGSVAGRQYSISWTASLTNTFGSLVTGLPATPSLNSYTDTVHTAVTAIFYRIGVSLAP